MNVPLLFGLVSILCGFLIHQCLNQYFGSTSYQYLMNQFSLADIYKKINIAFLIIF